MRKFNCGVFITRSISVLGIQRLTAFEPEAKGNLVEGLEFHRFYFDNGEFLVILILAGDVLTSYIRLPEW